MPLCQDYLEGDVTESGYYQIDPDGDEGDIAPFEVYCDFDSYPDIAITNIGCDIVKMILRRKRITVHSIVNSTTGTIVKIEQSWMAVKIQAVIQKMLPT